MRPSGDNWAIVLEKLSPTQRSNHMLTSLLYSPGTIIAAIVLLVLIIFTVVPDLADRTATVFNRVSSFFRGVAASLWGVVVSIWRFSGEMARQQRRIDRAVQEELARRYKQRLNTSAGNQYK